VIFSGCEKEEMGGGLEERLEALLGAATGVAVAGGGNDAYSLMLKSTKSRVGSSEESRLCSVYPVCPFFFKSHVNYCTTAHSVTIYILILFIHTCIPSHSSIVPV
jgi:hypothetical protein